MEACEEEDGSSNQTAHFSFYPSPPRGGSLFFSLNYIKKSTPNLIVISSSPLPLQTLT
jgi:hypothetical protein